MATGGSSGPDWDSGFAPEDRFGSEYSKLLLEQYKLYVDSSSKVSDRRGATQTFFLSANTLLATVYGLAVGKESAIGSLGSWLIPLAGVLLALSWLLLIQSYSSLNSAKFRVIEKLEQRLPVQLFTLEWQVIKNSASGRRYVPLNRIERLIPLTFALFFAGLIIRALI